MGANLSIHRPADTGQNNSLTPIPTGDTIQGSLDQGDLVKRNICAIQTINENSNLLGKLDGIDHVPICHAANQTDTDGCEGDLSNPSVAVLDNRHLKRRRSSPGISPEPKKPKLEQAVSPILCAGNVSKPKHQDSEAESTSDWLYCPSPLSGPASKPCEEELVPTVPNTPLPNSVDYARSKANPMVRTIAVYRQRSLEYVDIPLIPPVPIIAPPQDIGPVQIQGPEDQATNRLKALLRRERSERETDGLNVQDGMRANRLKAMDPIESAFAHRDSASPTGAGTSSQWEEDSTVGFEESQPPEHSARVVHMQGQHQLVDRETWSCAFGIENNLRREIIEWILKNQPSKPTSFEEPSPDMRQPGNNLYDQLTNVPQTRFHAAHLFLRYSRVPEKAEFWRGTCEHDCPKRDGGIWDLAVACIVLGVKLHRDCYAPLRHIVSVEFLELAPHPMTHAELECAQRDIMRTLQYSLGSCSTPQDVLDELWNALPTLRKATSLIPNGWTVVQGVVWDKLFESLFEPDMLQYPITLLTAAALLDGLVFALGEDKSALLAPTVSEGVPDDTKAISGKTSCFEAKQLVEDVVLDIRDVLELSEEELNECRTWMSYAGQK